jgi:hypothetical protein
VTFWKEYVCNIGHRHLTAVAVISV